MMTKLMMTAALALVLGAGAASAATIATDSSVAAPRLQFAQLTPQASFAQRQAARWGAVAPGSSAFSVGNFAGNANSGNVSVPGAPTATTVNGQ